MSIEQDLLNLKAKGERLVNLKVETATKLQMLEQEKDRLLAEAAELGIDPAKIEETLKSEEEAVQAEVSKLNEELDSILNDIRQIQ